MPNSNTFGVVEPPIELSIDPWIVRRQIPHRPGGREPGMDVSMGEGINSYMLEKLVANFQHGSLWEFIDFGNRHTVLPLGLGMIRDHLRGARGPQQAGVRVVRLEFAALRRSRGRPDCSQGAIVSGLRR
jgi:hypothetical protein